MYIPFSLSGLLAYTFRSLGANHRLLTHLRKASMDFLLSMAKGNKYFGFTMLEVLSFFSTSGVSQNGQLSAVTLGFSVDEAPQELHFTVCTSSLASEGRLASLRNFSKSISSTTTSFCSPTISLAAPQYWHFRCVVPGSNLRVAPQSLHLV